VRKGRTRLPLRVEGWSAPLKLALVSWSGDIGGAEVVTATLAREWRALGVDASVLFVTHPGRLGARLDAMGVPYAALGLSRGRHIVSHPRRFARALTAVGPDGALLPDCGYMAAVLRAAGYAARLVAVEHGHLFVLGSLPFPSRLIHSFGRFAGAKARSVDVAVSDFVLAQLRRHPHARRACRIYNFVDLNGIRPKPVEHRESERLVVGCVARLIRGKGVDHLIRAVGAVAQTAEVELRVLGDGPERPTLARLIEELGVGDVVKLCGFGEDIATFWAGVDVAAVPSESIEPFCVAALEAMACGKPVIFTRNGGLPEVVQNGESGLLVEPADPDALANALTVYLHNPSMLRRHGESAKTRAWTQFNPSELALEYLALFTDQSHTGSYPV